MNGIALWMQKVFGLFNASVNLELFSRTQMRSELERVSDRADVWFLLFYRKKPE
jgi:hypothetical protein